MSAVTSTKSVSLRIILTSARALDVVFAALAAVALALAFPKANLAWLAPLGAAALFWLWNTSSWKRALLARMVRRSIFFGISFSWFGYTVDGYLGPWAPASGHRTRDPRGLLHRPSRSRSLASLPEGYADWSPTRRCSRVPRIRRAALDRLDSPSPFAQLGYSQANTPLALFAAYIGTYGVTFVVCLIGAYLADASAQRFETPARISDAALLGTIAIALDASAGGRGPPASEYGDTITTRRSNSRQHYAIAKMDPRRSIQ